MDLNLNLNTTIDCFFNNILIIDTQPIDFIIKIFL